MDYYDINRLNKCLPGHRRPLAVVPPAASRPSIASLFSEDDTTNFMFAYNNPTFGWSAAARLYYAGADRFPVFPERKMKWVHKAWMLLRNHDTYRHDPRFSAVVDAYDIHTRASNTVTRSVMEAALIVKDGVCEVIADHLGMRSDVLEAYDALFFNVLDRKEDKMFLRNVVYPNTKLEEMVEHYLFRSSLGRVLLRMGYNRSLEEVLYFAGFRTDYTNGITAAQAQDMFSRETMLQGYLLASNGFLNYEKQHVTIGAAKSLVVAAKLGGTDTGQEASVGVLSDTIWDQLSGDRDYMRADCN